MRFLALFITALMLVGPLPSGGPLKAAELQPLEIVTKSGVRSFAVELAVTETELSRGLMYRRELPEGRGMLFDFKRDQPIGMWMKNTYIPLDMIFIRSDSTISQIAEDTKPHSTQIIMSAEPAQAVLEVIAGTARKMGIAPGDKVLHPIFRRR